MRKISRVFTPKGVGCNVIRRVIKKEISQPSSQAISALTGDVGVFSGDTFSCVYYSCQIDAFTLFIFLSTQSEATNLLSPKQL